MRSGGCNQPDETNPYIALADLAISLVLILAFFVSAVAALGRAGWEQLRYREAQQQIRRAVDESLPRQLRPREHKGKNDPPGVQRWVFTGGDLFQPGTKVLRPAGSQALIRFAGVLGKHRYLWRRLQIEGHTLPPPNGLPDDWDLSAGRAATVARVFSVQGHLSQNALKVAGKGGQDPISKVIVYMRPNDPASQKVGWFLTTHNVLFSQKNVDTDRQAQEEMKKRGISVLPATTAKELVVAGFDPDALGHVTADYRANERVEVLVEYGANPLRPSGASQ